MLNKKVFMNNVNKIVKGLAIGAMSFSLLGVGSVAMNNHSANANVHAEEIDGIPVSGKANGDTWHVSNKVANSAVIGDLSAKQQHQITVNDAKWNKKYGKQVRKYESTTTPRSLRRNIKRNRKSVNHKRRVIKRVRHARRNTRKRGKKVNYRRLTAKQNREIRNLKNEVRKLQRQIRTMKRELRHARHARR